MYFYWIQTFLNEKKSKFFIKLTKIQKCYMKKRKTIANIYSKYSIEMTYYLLNEIINYNRKCQKVFDFCYKQWLKQKSKNIKLLTNN